MRPRAKRGMRGHFPIPKGWDRQSFVCFRIMWPDNQEWIDLLSTILINLDYGRNWDERTGVVKDAQFEGWLVSNENTPLAFCTSDDSGSGSEARIHAGAFQGFGGACEIDESEDEDMGCCFAQGPDGRLYIPCNGGWIPVPDLPSGALVMGVANAISGGSIIDSSQTDGTSEIAPGAPSTWAEEDIACAKATWTVEFMWNILEASWDARGALTPMNWIETTKQASAGLDWNTAAMWVAWATINLLDPIFLSGDFASEFTATDKSLLICEIVDNMDSADWEVTGHEWTKILFSLGQVLSSGPAAYATALFACVQTGTENLTEWFGIPAKYAYDPADPPVCCEDNQYYGLPGWTETLPWAYVGDMRQADARAVWSWGGAYDADGIYTAFTAGSDNGPELQRVLSNAGGEVATHAYLELKAGTIPIVGTQSFLVRFGNLDFMLTPDMLDFPIAAGEVARVQVQGLEQVLPAAATVRVYCVLNSDTHSDPWDEAESLRLVRFAIGGTGANPFM